MLTYARKVVFQINDCKITSLEKMVNFFKTGKTGLVKFSIYFIT